MTFFQTGEKLSDVMRGRRVPLPPLELRMLVEYVSQLTRVQLITQSGRALTAHETTQLNDLISRRIDGEPMAYLLGVREFYGLTLEVNPAVLIPRPETELLVELALERIPENGSVLDMGTGSGAIAIAIAHVRPDVKVAALDVSAAALDVARRNAQRHQLRIDFLQSDWFTALASQSFDVIASNPPYIVAGDAHLSQGDLRFEPADALTDHADGLSAIRKLIDGAPRYLARNGWLLMEHGYDQAEPARALLAARGLDDAQSWRDLSGIARVTGGRYRSD